VTVNVNLWPHRLLLTNSGHFARLTSKEQVWLREAAAEAAMRSTSMYDHDRRLTVVLCNSGAHIVNATPSELAALGNAFAPVYAVLRRDAQTSAFITQIDQMKRSIRQSPALPIPAGCAGTPGAASVASQPVAGRGALNGTYRFTVTDAELKANGFGGAYRVSQSHGLFTIVGGGLAYWRADPLADASSDGRWNARRPITFTFAAGARLGSPAAANSAMEAHRQDLRFAERGGQFHRTDLVSQPWKKIR
jgi:hypothetical protein